MLARVKPWMLWTGAAIAGYFVVRKLLDDDVRVHELPSLDTRYYGLAVRWISPASGGDVDRAPWSGSYPVSFELHNDSTQSIEGFIEVTVDEDGLTADSRVTTTAGPYTFGPGERRIVELELKTNALLATWARATVRLGGQLAQPVADPRWLITMGL